MAVFCEASDDIDFVLFWMSRSVSKVDGNICSAHGGYLFTFLPVLLVPFTS